MSAGPIRRFGVGGRKVRLPRMQGAAGENRAEGSSSAFDRVMAAGNCHPAPSGEPAVLVIAASEVPEMDVDQSPGMTRRTVSRVGGR
jgi:hypothetical protein